MHNWNNRVLIFGAGIVQGTYAGFLPLSGEVPDGEQNTSTHENMASFCCDVFVYQGPQVSQDIRKEKVRRNLARGIGPSGWKVLSRGFTIMSIM